MDGQEENKDEVEMDRKKQLDAVRTGTPRKSKAKELTLKEEFCVFCYGSPSSNDEDPEELLRCSECLKYAHPTCLEIPLDAVEKTRCYDWQCNDCKGCFICKKKNKEKSIILCDFCDRGFHTFCLEKKPTAARRTSWKCPCCQKDERVMHNTEIERTDMGCAVEVHISYSSRMEHHTKVISSKELAAKMEAKDSVKEDASKSSVCDASQDVVSEIEILGTPEESSSKMEVDEHVTEGWAKAVLCKNIGIESLQKLEIDTSKSVEIVNNSESSGFNRRERHSKNITTGQIEGLNVTLEKREEDSEKGDRKRGVKRNSRQGRIKELIEKFEEGAPKKCERISDQEEVSKSTDKQHEGEENSKEDEMRSEKDETGPVFKKSRKKEYVRSRCSRRLSTNIGDVETGQGKDGDLLEKHSAEATQPLESKCDMEQTVQREQKEQGVQKEKKKRKEKRAQSRRNGEMRQNAVNTRRSNRLSFHGRSIEPRMTIPETIEIKDEEKLDASSKHEHDAKEKEVNGITETGGRKQRKSLSKATPKQEKDENEEVVEKEAEMKNEGNDEVETRESEESSSEENKSELRKRGRPKRYLEPNRQSSKSTDPHKTANKGKHRKRTSAVVIKDLNGTTFDDEQEGRVLRKTSREPAITPTTARSILSAHTVQRVYPIRSESSPTVKNSDRFSPRTPSRKVAISPRGTSGKLSKSCPRSTPKTPKTLRSAGKSSTRKSTDTRSSTTKKSGSNRSEGRRLEKKKSTQRSSDRKPRSADTKLAERKNIIKDLTKRKLAFDENPKDIKRMRKAVVDKKDDEAVQRSRRRSKVNKAEDDDESSMTVGDSDLENIVSLADIALFKQAQENVKLSMETVDAKSTEQGIRAVAFGEYEIDTWYSSPYPNEYKLLGKVFVCEYCLKYVKSATILRRHMAKCLWRHPPGDEIYRKGNISVFEVDGEKSSAYCQNLCLFAKLFLDHKTLYYEVEPFLFYVMTVADCSGCHMVGYFSKEKVSFLNYNVSCILVLPHCMRKGYGKILIDFSYLLSRVEGKTGSPERPLSDLGLISYRSYWKDVLLRYLNTFPDDQVSIKEVSQKTSVMSSDLISTMQYLGMLKYWKGKHVISIQQEILDVYAAKTNARDKLKTNVDESCLEWTPKDYGQGKNRSKNP